MKIIIVGCGRLGSRLADIMARRGDEVTVVDLNPNAFERLGTDFRGKTVAGVGFDGEVLLKAGIQSTDALAAVTSSDETNIVTARLARQVFKVPKVVARIYEPDNLVTFERLGLQTFCPVEWGVQRVIDLFSYTPMDVMFSLGTGEVDILEKKVPDMLVGKSVSSLAARGEIMVVAISRRGSTMIASPEMVFEDGDTIHLAVLDRASNGLKKFLG